VCVVSFCSVDLPDEGQDWFSYTGPCPKPQIIEIVPIYHIVVIQKAQGGISPHLQLQLGAAQELHQHREAAISYDTKVPLLDWNFHGIIVL
jgi:hypothetical protein